MATFLWRLVYTEKCEFKIQLKYQMKKFVIPGTQDFEILMSTNPSGPARPKDYNPGGYQGTADTDPCLNLKTFLFLIDLLSFSY